VIIEKLEVVDLRRRKPDSDREQNLMSILEKLKAVDLRRRDSKHGETEKATVESLVIASEKMTRII